MASLLWWCVGMVGCLLCLFQTSEGTGKIEIKIIRFQSSCLDNWYTSECDTYFIFCIDRQRRPNVDQCTYKRSQSGHFHDDSSITFGTDIQGVANPIVAPASSFPSGGASDVMFSLQAWDKDSITSDDHIATLSLNISYTPARSSAQANWISTYRHSGSSHMWLSYRLYCDADYYTSRCDVYCRARDDSVGHYTCEEGTGQKICLTGWTGENCDEDVDECEMSMCENNSTCANLPGTYNCTCLQGYIGQNCSLIDSLCHSAPCQNGGACSGDLLGYNCTCPFEWEGTNCETQVDFCETNPCENNGTCYATLGNYTCLCARGWTGDNCTIEIDACESSPCQNGGNCTMLPAEEYLCTCPYLYEGKDCQSEKNPCEPNPCNNSGSCIELTYDTYNCSCVFGFLGENCNQFIDTKSESSSQKSEDTFPDWLPIVIALVSALIVIIIIIFVACFIRRRRQKQDIEDITREKQVKVIHVVGSDNLAFRNAEYDHNNRANSLVEARGNRNSQTGSKRMASGEQGAVGGYNPYQEIEQPTGKYMDMAGAVCGEKGKCEGSNPRASMLLYDNPRAPAENPYTDFESLRRRPLEMNETSEYANGPKDLHQTDKAMVDEEEEENLYHDLDSVALDANIALEIQPPAHPPPRCIPSPALEIQPPAHPPPRCIPTPALYDNPRPTNHSPTNHSTPEYATPRRVLLPPSAGVMHLNTSRPGTAQTDAERPPESDEDGESQEDIATLRREVVDRSGNNQTSVA